MRWLPARAWENGVYAVFSNVVGVDGGTIKPGLAMILDPFGEVLAESQVLGDDVVVALLTPEKLDQSSGRRYLRAASGALRQAGRTSPAGPKARHKARVGSGRRPNRGPMIPTLATHSTWIASN